jgi:threonine synthase
VCARDQSRGIIDKVTDEQILEAYQLIARFEGIFCEPASAASLAGLVKLIPQKYFTKRQKIVCTLTGHGLKDPDTAIAFSEKPVGATGDAVSIRKKMNL